MKMQGMRIAKTILKKQNKIGKLTFPNFKSYCKLQQSRQCGTSYKHRHIDKWNRIKNPEINTIGLQ